MAQEKSRAFLMTAERLARMTTSVISRTIASKRLFNTDIRKGSTRRSEVSSSGLLVESMAVIASYSRWVRRR